MAADEIGAMIAALFEKSTLAGLVSLGVLIAGWRWKSNQEKGENKSQSEELASALSIERERRIKAEEGETSERLRADQAFARQLEMVEQFSAMRAETAKTAEAMLSMQRDVNRATSEVERLSKALELSTQENAGLRQQMGLMAEEISQLKQTIQASTRI